jgi:NAD(P)-dependent dehydrogenase (short-subunit alcohol dehydrogenase family)
METALIVGAGSGLSASLARLLEQESWRVALAARNPEKLKGFALRCDAPVPVRLWLPGKVPSIWSREKRLVRSASLPRRNLYTGRVCKPLDVCEA